MRAAVGLSRSQFAVSLTVASGIDQNASNSATGPQGLGYSILGDMFDASRREQVDYSGGVWSVSRPHTNAVILELAERYGQVKVIHHGGVDKCVDQCWDRGKPENACLCVGLRRQESRIGEAIRAQGRRQWAGWSTLDSSE